MLDVIERYENDVSREHDRVEKDIRYCVYELSRDKEINLDDKIRFGIELSKMALRNAEKPALSCSFGIDSIVTLWMAYKAMDELGMERDKLTVIWNNTLNEFPEVREFADWITEEWGINLQVYKPKKPLKKIIDDNGGVTDEYFTNRKSDRRNNEKPLSEKCCGTLKHEPMRRAIKENEFDLIFTGQRSDESSQRKIAGLRDGDYFYSKSEWKSFMCKPIQYITEKELWQFVYEYDIPFNDLYNKNLIKKYPPQEKATFNIMTNYDELKNLGLDVDALLDQQVSTVDRRQAIRLKELDFEIFTPRTGCQMCPIPVKYGYLGWMRRYYPKVYKAMIYNLGYGPALMNLIPDEVKNDVEGFTGYNLTSENASDILEEILDYRPCVFDELKT